MNEAGWKACLWRNKKSRGKSKDRAIQAAAIHSPPLASSVAGLQSQPLSRSPLL
jgi:hypothetical protein